MKWIGVDQTRRCPRCSLRDSGGRCPDRGKLPGKLPASRRWCTALSAPPPPVPGRESSGCSRFHTRERARAYLYGALGFRRGVPQALPTDCGLHFGATDIHSNGGFVSDDVTVVHPERTVTGPSGSRDGRLSNRPDTDGNPRLVAGSAAVEFVEADGSVGEFRSLFTARGRMSSCPRSESESLSRRRTEAPALPAVLPSAGSPVRRRRAHGSTAAVRRVVSAWERERAHLGARPEPIPEPFDIAVTRRVGADCTVAQAMSHGARVGPIAPFDHGGLDGRGSADLVRSRVPGCRRGGATRRAVAAVQSAGCRACRASRSSGR